MKEKSLWKLNGFIGVLIAAVLAGVGVYFALQFMATGSVFPLVMAVIIGILFVVALSGFAVIQPNQAKVFTFFGSYIGVIREAGFWFTVPLTEKSHVSLRVLNFNSDKLKVNDLEGNPIEIAAVVVYRVTDAAKAMFDVEQYERFVQTQSETSIRQVATQYPYDNFTEENKITLRQHSDEIADELQRDLQKRLEVAGVEVMEARIMHLAYSSEIASAMLQRQQAQAVLGARKVIVDGAVTMVKSAIDQLSTQGVVDLDDEKKAQMVNNLMVALVSENASQPIINTGTVY